MPRSSPLPSPTPTSPPTAIPSPTSIPDGAAILQYPAQALVLDLAFSPDGALLAVVAGNDVFVYDAREVVARLPVGAWTNRLVFHPTRPLLALAVKDGSLQFWNYRNGARVCVVEDAHPQGVNSLAFHPVGTWLASAGNDAIVWLWDVSSVLTGGCQVAQVGAMIGRAYTSSAVAFSARGDLLALVDQQDIRLRDPATRRLMAFLDGDASIFALAFSPDDTLLAAAEMGAAVRLWDLQDRSTPTGRLLSPDTANPTAYTWAVTFSPDGRWLAAGSSDGSIRLWDPFSAEQVAVFQHGGPVTALAFGPDGELLSGGLDAAVRQWSLP
ncbi:MAG: WD40 repeat domain-containing protein [Anaerolineales bacterium]|nr:WD40 repeat domain-containing protein [Anaerolineales bacterium]